jgi:hypothetical protein
MSVNKNSLDNLVNISEQGLTSEQRRENGRKGGQASGRTRRAKKEMKELINEILDMNIRDGKTETFKNIADSKGKNINVTQALVLAQVKKALNGDTRALEFLRDTAGLKPINKQETHVTVTSSGKLNDILEQLSEEDETEV